MTQVNQTGRTRVPSIPADSPSRFNATAVNTTSGASVIIKTSGANTIYITDIIVSADVECTVTLMSAATTAMTLYLAANGGAAPNLNSPLVLNSNQSFTFQPSVSGSCSVWCGGYTVS